jgi:hypothetical protein
MWSVHMGRSCSSIVSDRPLSWSMSLCYQRFGCSHCRLVTVYLHL